MGIPRDFKGGMAYGSEESQWDETHQRKWLVNGRGHIITTGEGNA